MNLQWKRLLLENRWQKLFALGLSILIWFTVRSTERLRIIDDGADGTRVFASLPIVVLTAASDLGRYEVKPESVSVELRGDTSGLLQLPPNLIEAYVNLVDLGRTPESVEIHVNPPPGTEVVSIRPNRVLVNRIADAPPSPKPNP